MKTFSFISESLTAALGWTLLHAIWQGFALVLIAALAMYLLRHRSSYARYWTGIVAIFSQLSASIITFIVYYQPFVAAVTVSKLNTSAQYLASRVAYTPVALPWYKEALLFLQSHLDTIVLFWGIGASVLLIRLVGSWVYVQQLRAEGIRLTEARVQTLFRTISTALRIRQNVHLFESVRVKTPMVIGFIKPIVLLPVGLVTGLTTKQIEAILAHELAHVKRYDYLINLLQSLAEVVYFFHPALWWLSGKVRQEREHCCDDIAINVCGDKLAFVQALSEVATYQQTPELAMAFASNKGALLYRVRRVLGVSPQSSPNSGHLGGVLLAILLTLGVSVYAIQQEGKPKQAKAKNIGKIMKKSADGTRIEMDENLKLSKIVWKKRTLSTTEVAQIQQLKTQVEAGELNLDNIKNIQQRDILLYLFEIKAGLDSGLAALSNIDLENGVDTEAPLEAINEEAMVAIQPMIDAVVAVRLDSVEDKKIAFHSHKIDSLSRLMEPQHQKMEALRRDMEQHEFKVEELERKMEVMEWKRSKFYEQRGQLLEKRNRSLHQEGQKTKKSESEIEKELAQFEEQIKQQEAQIQQFNHQSTELRQQIKTTRQPIEELEKQMRQLEALNERYSEEMNRHSTELHRAFPPPPPPMPSVKAAKAPKAVIQPRAPKPAVEPAVSKPPAPPKKKP